MDGIFSDAFSNISSWYDSAKSTLNTALKLVNPVYAVASNATEQLKKAAEKWKNEYKELQRIDPINLSPELKAERIELLKRGNSIVSKLQSMGMGADLVQSQLGGVQIIAAAVIATAASLIAYWANDYLKFRSKLSEYQAAIKSGASISEASQILDSLDSSVWGNMSKVAKYGTIGVGLFMLGTVIIPRLKK